MTIRYSTKLSLRKFIYLLLFFFTIDGVFHITRQVPVIGIGVREWLLILMIALSIPLLISNRYWVANKYSFSVMLMLVLVAIAIIRDYIGSKTTEYIRDLIYEYIYYFYFFIMLIAITGKSEFLRILRLITILGSILSLFSAIVEIGNIITPSLSAPLVSLAAHMEFMNVYNRYGIVTRIMWTGVVVQVIAFFLCIAFYIERGKWKYILLTVLNGVGIILTYSRGLIVGVLGGVVAFLLLQRKTANKNSVRVWKVIMSGTILSIIIIEFSAVFFPEVFGFLFERFSVKEISTTSSDSLRDTMTEMLYQLIEKNPIVGGGAGAHIDLRDGRVEMTFHDIISKMGFLGIIVFLIPFFFIVKDYLQKFRTDSLNCIRIGLIASLVSILIATYTNPYILGSLGLLLYCLCMRMSINGANALKGGICK